MATNDFAKTITLTAGAAIALYRFVKISGPNVIQGAALGDDCVGVSAEAAAASGDALAVAIYNGGVFRVEAGAAIAVGTVVGPDAVGRAVTATAAANRMNGYVLDAAAAAGDIVRILMVKGASHTSATGV